METPAAPVDPIAIRARAAIWAAQFTLPFRRGPSAAAGGLRSSGAGSSLEYHDHRPYIAGDDPRAIDWNAFARTDQLTLKVYREETRPIVDVAIDGTASMAVSPKKATRALELALLCIAAGERAGASVRVSCVWQGGTSEGDAALMSADFGTRPGNATEPLAWDQVRWRPGGLRVVVSDFLSSIPPSDFFTSQGTARCVPILLAPYDREEADPDWTGQVDLIDCESAERRDLHFDSAAAERYRGAYSSHFESWREATLRREGIFARVNSAGDLPAALLEEAIPAGAFGFER